MVKAEAGRQSVSVVCSEMCHGSDVLCLIVAPTNVQIINFSCPWIINGFVLFIAGAFLRFTILVQLMWKLGDEKKPANCGL